MHGRPVPRHLFKLLDKDIKEISSFISQCVDLLAKKQQNSFSSGELSGKSSGWIFDCLRGFEPHLLLSASENMGQKYLGPFVIHLLEQANYFVQVMDVSSLLSKSDQVRF